LRDAVSDLALHYLAKLKILLVKDIERDEIEFTCKTLQASQTLQTETRFFVHTVTYLQCSPIASVDGLLTAKLGLAELVEEISTADGDDIYAYLIMFQLICFVLMTHLFAGKIVKITGVPQPCKTMTILCRSI
jgi:T-complex protein 1 subunit delta